MPPDRGVGESGVSMVAVPIRVSSGHLGPSSGTTSPHIGWPPGPGLASICTAPLKSTEKDSSSDGLGVVGLCACGTVILTSRLVDAPALPGSAPSVTAGLNESSLHPVVRRYG